MNGLQALLEWEKFMGNPTGAWLDFVNASQSLGAVISYFWVAYSSDMFGRKATFLQGYFWLLLSNHPNGGAKQSDVHCRQNASWRCYGLLWVLFAGSYCRIGLPNPSRCLNCHVLMWLCRLAACCLDLFRCTGLHEFLGLENSFDHSTSRPSSTAGGHSRSPRVSSVASF